jgi:hypothetical protein
MEDELGNAKDLEQEAAERVIAERFAPLPPTKRHYHPNYRNVPPENLIEYERSRRALIFRYEHEGHPMHDVTLNPSKLNDVESDMWAVAQAEWIKWVHPERYEAALDAEKYRTYYERYPDERDAETGLPESHPGSRPDAPDCQFIKSDGTRCGSPAMKNKRLCYFHEQTADSRRRKGSAQAAPRRFQLPVLEDDRAIQMAVTNVCRCLVNDALDAKRATTLLYGLQVASSALRRKAAIGDGR